MALKPQNEVATSVTLTLTFELDVVHHTVIGQGPETFILIQG